MIKISAGRMDNIKNYLQFAAPAAPAASDDVTSQDRTASQVHAFRKQKYWYQSFITSKAPNHWPRRIRYRDESSIPFHACMKIPIPCSHLPCHNEKLEGMMMPAMYCVKSTNAMISVPERDRERIDLENEGCSLGFLVSTVDTY